MLILKYKKTPFLVKGVFFHFNKLTNIFDDHATFWNRRHADDTIA
jgi:hypothetical protein